MDIISTFHERPKTRGAVWAFRLGVIALLSPTILGMFAAVGRPFVESLTGETVAIGIGVTLAFAVLALVVVAFVLSVRAYRTGERSWMLWFGLVPASLAVLFWIFMLVGEFLFPH